MDESTTTEWNTMERSGLSKTKADFISCVHVLSATSDEAL